jgi:hypothetical protein
MISYRGGLLDANILHSTAALLEWDYWREIKLSSAVQEETPGEEINCYRAGTTYTHSVLTTVVLDADLQEDY